MSEYSGNIYKMCRETARITQNTASEHLHINPRTLSAYENGAKVPDDIVAAMVEVYNTPLLAWKHLKETNVLGKNLPDVIMPQTFGDMGFQLHLSEKELTKAAGAMIEILADHKLEAHEIETYDKSMDLLSSINSKITSVLIYGRQIRKEWADANKHLVKEVL